MTLRKALEAARSAGKSAFIPFVVAGDPDMETCEKIIMALEKEGAAALELGVPFSDPVADGVTVQRASERALAKGATLAGVLDLVKRLRSRGLALPICLFSYLNPIFKMGYENFVRDAKAAGAQGALIVDLRAGGGRRILRRGEEACLRNRFPELPHHLRGAHAAYRRLVDGVRLLCVARGRDGHAERAAAAAS
jgi:tryptophan synthase alpha subunit